VALVGALRDLQMPNLVIEDDVLRAEIANLAKRHPG